MESQESDICGPEILEELLRDINPTRLEDGFDCDWSTIHIPEGATGELPAREPYPGHHKFEVKVDFNGNHKKSYVYSSKLNKLFVDLGNVVPFQIAWDGTPDLYIRALMMFNLPDSWKNPVRRCIAHRDKDSPTNQNYDHTEHVLATVNANASYQVNEQSLRHSVVVPLTLQQGCGYTNVSYKFMCKTSCSGGLNRLPTDVIFTLEDSAANVLGRQTVSIKICSCPKRDKEKEEINLGDPPGKRKMKVKKEEKAAQKAVEPPAKRIKQEFCPDSNPSSTFMVTAVNPVVAGMLKDHIRKWAEIKAVELWGQSSAASPQLITITEDVAVIQQPFM